MIPESPLRPGRIPRWLFSLTLLLLAGTTAAHAAEAPLSDPREVTAPTPSAVNLTGTARDSRIRELGTLLDLRRNSPRVPNRDGRRALARDLHEWQRLRQARAAERAQLPGLPLTGETVDLRPFALVDWEGGRPRYLITTNANAAISTAANLVRQTAPFTVDGAGLRLGEWDAALALPTHVEFGGRVTAGDATASTHYHSTHVAGTMVAAGINASAKGMAPAASLLSFDWNTDLAEMAAFGAILPGDSDAIPLSNHSYSFISGWNGTDWYGAYSPNGVADDFEDDFGRYSTDAVALDAVVVTDPYYLPFWAAGNDRDDSAPSTGSSWRYINALGFWTTINSYNPALHPPGDATYKSGYDTIGVQGVAKNLLTVGAVNDAVIAGARNLGAASMVSFSSWGPTDDGRIKPDIVANGASLTSTDNLSNNAYLTISGTSMATPNASGSAALLVDLFGKRFPGSAMRASTLKALIIHTADDLGTAGPDYAYGWGLMNTLTAAQGIETHASASASRRLLEGRLTASTTSATFAFVWDGVSPIRATLVWTDPSGAEKTGHENRAPALVNNLDLSITGPDATVHRPWIMPHVGDWSLASLDDAATTGINTVDNVEQVWLATPSLAGIYTVSVGLAGSLTGSEQAYSLIVSGLAQTAVVPTISGVTGTNCDPAPVFATVTGAGFQLGGTLALDRPGQATVGLAGAEVFTDAARVRVDPRGFTPGWWNLKLTNPDGTYAVAPQAVAVPHTLAYETIEGSLAKWTTGTSGAGIAWGSTTSLAASPVRALYGQGSTAAGLSDLYLAPVTFPLGATCCRLSFAYWYSLQSRADAGVLEVSFNNGSTWSDITAAGGSFAEGGYNDTLNTATNPLGPSGTSVWTGTTLVFGGFVTSRVELDPNIYGGQTVRFRWRLGSNTGTASTGWVIDDVTISADTSTLWQPFEYWRFNTLGDAFVDEDSDDNGNGRSLFAEYAFGTDSEMASGTPVTVNTAAGFLQITFPVRLEATDLIYTVQISNDMTTWTDAAVYTSNGATVQRNTATNTVAVGTSPDGARVLVTERHAIPIAAAPRQFARVVVTRPGA